jgi:hypothetical protein
MANATDLPHEDLMQAAEILHAFRSKSDVSSDDIDALIRWLAQARFDVSTFWVGEPAAGLISAYGEAKHYQRLHELLDSADDWHRYLYLLAAIEQIEWKDFDANVELASQSHEPVVSAFGKEIQSFLRSPMGVAKRMIRTAMSDLGAESATLYMRDPSWLDEYRLVLMPGVTMREPMHGFLFPLRTKQVIEEGDTEWIVLQPANRLHDGRRESDTLGLQLDHRPVSERAKIRRLFGSFAEREHVECMARYQIGDGSHIDAVVFFNFSHTASISNEQRACMRLCADALKAQLRNLKEQIRQSDRLALARLARVSQLSAQLATSQLGIQEHFAHILKSLFGALNLGRDTAAGTIHLYDPENEVLRLAAEYGNVERRDKAWAQWTRKAEGVISWVALKSRGVLVEDLDVSAFRAIHRTILSGVRSQLAVPMIARGQVVGVINLESVIPGTFVSEDVRIVWQVANQAAAAVWLCHDEITENRSILSRLMQLVTRRGRIVGYATLKELAGAAKEHLRASFVDLWRFNVRTRQFDMAGSSDPEFREADGPRVDGWSQFVRETCIPVWIADINAQQIDVQYWHRDGIWRPQPPPEYLGIAVPEAVNPNLVCRRGVGSEVGIPVTTTEAGETTCIGVMWLKYSDRAPLVPVYESMLSALWFAENAALVMNRIPVSMRSA